MNRRLVVGVTGGLAGALLLLSTAGACVGGPILSVSPTEARAGADVTLTGISFDKSLPLVVRFDALDGPIVGTFSINEDRALPAATVRIPAGTRPGGHVLIGTQPAANGDQAVVPTRALVVVVGDGGLPAGGASVLGEETGRPTSLVEKERSVNLGALVLFGLGGFAAAILIAGAVASLFSGRRPDPAAARAARS